MICNKIYSSIFGGLFEFKLYKIYPKIRKSKTIKEFVIAINFESMSFPRSLYPLEIKKTKTFIMVCVSVTLEVYGICLLL